MAMSTMASGDAKSQNPNLLRTRTFCSELFSRQTHTPIDWKFHCASFAVWVCRLNILLQSVHPFLIYIGLVPVQALQRTVPQHPGRRQWPPGSHPQLWCAAQGRGPPLGGAASPHRAPYHRPFPGSQGCGASQPARSYEKSQPASHACERAIVQIACKFEYSMQKICDAGCWLEIAYDPASQPRLIMWY